MPYDLEHKQGSTQSYRDKWGFKFNQALARLREPGAIAGGAGNYMQGLLEQTFPQRVQQVAAMGVPGVSDAAGLLSDGMMYANDPASRTPGNAALTGLGLLPFIPAMTAYHGSPHKFDKFELSDKTIGTGEGAQAYGHGLYFAESKGTADSYRKTLSDTEGLLPLIEGRKHAISVMQKRLDSGGDPEVYGPQIESLKREIAEMEGNLKTGALYEVDIPDDRIAQMLDWDAPLSEQPRSVRDALGKIFERDLETETGWRKLTGREAYEAVVERTGMPDKGASASKMLRELGIPGIRYLDGASRADGKGTRNFVVFDDSIVKILKRE